MQLTERNPTVIGGVMLFAILFLSEVPLERDEELNDRLDESPEPIE